VRVTRPGGVIVTTAWSGDDMFATRSEVVADRHPALFERGGPDPRAWADPDGLAAIYAGLDVEFTVKRRTRWLGYASGEAAMETFEVASGPIRRLRHAVEQAGGSWAAPVSASLRSHPARSSGSIPANVSADRASRRGRRRRAIARRSACHIVTSGSASFARCPGRAGARSRLAPTTSCGLSRPDPGECSIDGR
jgi:hypothetical protein